MVEEDEAFFAGVIKESEMMLEWAAEQTTGITTTAIDLEFLLTDTNVDRGLQNLEFVLQQMHTALMALTSCEANDIVANSRKNPFISTGRCSLLELQAGIERWESYVSRYEKTLKDKLKDEIKLAGLEALVPVELEKHLILNSNRLRTFEDARLEIVTYVEAKFGLRISKPGDKGSREHSDPMDVGAVNSLSRQSKEKGHQVRVVSVLIKCGGAHFQRDCNARAQASNRMAKVHKASHGPRVRAKERVKTTRENPQESPPSEESSQRCLEMKKQQQQQQQDTPLRTGKPVADQHQGIPTGTPRNPTSTRKPVAEEENPFEVDLRLQGIPQDPVLEDQGRITNIQELVDKLRTENQTESIVADLGKA